MAYYISLKDRREFILGIRATAQKCYNSCVDFKSEKWCLASSSDFRLIKVSKSNYENNC